MGRSWRLFEQAMQHEVQNAIVKRLVPNRVLYQLFCQHQLPSGPCRLRVQSADWAAWIAARVIHVPLCCV